MHSSLPLDKQKHCSSKSQCSPKVRKFILKEKGSETKKKVNPGNKVCTGKFFHRTGTHTSKLISNGFTEIVPAPPGRNSSIPKKTFNNVKKKVFEKKQNRFAKCVNNLKNGNTTRPSWNTVFRVRTPEYNKKVIVEEPSHKKSLVVARKHKQKALEENLNLNASKTSPLINPSRDIIEISDNEKVVSQPPTNSIPCKEEVELNCTRTLTGHSKAVKYLLQIGSHLISCSSDSTLRVWDLKEENKSECKAVLKGHKGGVNQCCFLEKKRIIFSCSDDATIRAWDWTEVLPREIFVLKNKSKRPIINIESVHGNEKTENHIVCTRNCGGLELWKYETKTCIRVIQAHVKSITFLKCVTNEGFKGLVTVSLDKWVKVWPQDLDPTTGEISSYAHSGSVYCVEVYKHYIASGSQDGRMILSSIQKNELKIENQISIPDLEPIHVIRIWEYEKNDIRIVSAGPSGTVYLFSLGTESCCLKSMSTFASHSTWIMDLHIENSNNYILSCSLDRSLKLVKPKLDSKDCFDGAENCTLAFSSPVYRLFSTGLYNVIACLSDGNLVEIIFN